MRKCCLKKIAQNFFYCFKFTFVAKKALNEAYTTCFSFSKIKEVFSLIDQFLSTFINERYSITLLARK